MDIKRKNEIKKQVRNNLSLKKYIYLINLYIVINVEIYALKKLKRNTLENLIETARDIKKYINYYEKKLFLFGTISM
ncbi:hypothetical protein [uncultured Clostridium sp.]|uniref:hypothetical protein n=1 Tax=uncultured Clostridium sp. TaxID=59620 RepID=UPI0028E2B5BC|nr:hypothetical protein [uncultured Clostridium sp.]